MPNIKPNLSAGVYDVPPDFKTNTIDQHWRLWLKTPAGAQLSYLYARSDDTDHTTPVGQECYSYETITTVAAGQDCFEDVLSFQKGLGYLTCFAKDAAGWAGCDAVAASVDAQYLTP